MGSEIGIMEFWNALMDYTERLGVTPLNKHAGVWQKQVDCNWFIAVNAHRQSIVILDRHVEVQPFTCYVEFNGWPAGIIDPYQGAIAAGECANIRTLVEALKAATPQEVRDGEVS